VSRRAVLFLLALVFVALNPQPAQAVQTVTISDFDFSPQEIVVDEGTRVTWNYPIGSGVQTHSVTSDVDGRFDSQDINPGGSFNNIFVQPGTYRYYCKYHGSKGGQGMSGIVRVSGSAPSPTPSPKPSASASPRPKASATAKASSSPTARPAPSTSASPTTAAASPTPSATPTIIAAPLEKKAASGSRLPLAVALIAFLGGVSAIVYVRFFRRG
jgi:plastocyanin